MSSVRNKFTQFSKLLHRFVTPLGRQLLEPVKKLAARQSAANMRSIRLVRYHIGSQIHFRQVTSWRVMERLFTAGQLTMIDRTVHLPCNGNSCDAGLPASRWRTDPPLYRGLRFRTNMLISTTHSDDIISFKLAQFSEWVSIRFTPVLINGNFENRSLANKPIDSNNAHIDRSAF
jgi:hypothetical protein